MESGDSDDQHLDVTISTTNLSGAVEEETNNTAAAQVAGALQNYLSTLDQQAAADFMENEQLLAISDVDGLVTYLKQHHPNTDSLTSVITAVEQIQGEVFSNVLAHLASLRDGGRSGISTGDLIDQGSIWLKAIASEAEQDAQSREGFHLMATRVA